MIESSILIIAALLVIVAINIVMWFIYMPRFVSCRIGRFQSELVNRHYDEVEIMYRKMRGWRHDYHNHMQTLKAHMELGQYEQAYDYISMLDEDLASVDTMIKTGNVMVDAILNSKLTMIREKKISVDATAVVPEDISVSGVDLSVLIGNLMDNAMEACMQIAEEKDRFIRVYIDIMKKQLYICVTNSMEGKAKKTAGGYSTTKNGGEDVHGFGLISVDRIVSKYSGYLNRQSENGVFATEVMLPLQG